MSDTELHGPSGNSRAGGNSSTGLRVLEHGLLLEDRQILLPWGARLMQLTGSCQPSSHINKPAWDELLWRSPTILGGLHARSLQVVLSPYGWFDMGWVWLTSRSSCGSARCTRTALAATLTRYEHARQHLTTLLGPPTSADPSTSCEDFVRLSAWEQAPWRIGLFVRQGEMFEDYQFACLVHISHNPQRCAAGGKA